MIFMMVFRFFLSILLTFVSLELLWADRWKEVEVKTSRNGIVVAGHPEAATLGAEILERGGNAMDAAVVVSLALGIAEPYGSGIGGKLLYLYQPANNSEPIVIDALDEAPESWNPEQYSRLPRDERLYSWHAVAIPGLLAGLDYGHNKWGTLPWRNLVESVIPLAEQGAELLPGNLRLTQAAAYRLSDPELITWLLPKNLEEKVGKRSPTPLMANFLKQLAEEGVDWFYGREMAERVSLASGGLIKASDWKFQAREFAPLHMDLSNGMRIWLTPPPGMGGALVAAMLKLSEEEGWSFESAVDLDSYGRSYRYLDDGQRAIAEDSPEAITAVSTWLAEIKNDAPPVPSFRLSDPEIDFPSTTHFVIVDRHGNLISATQSLSHHFGAGVSIPGTHVILNNSLSNFSLAAAATANTPEPGKRPRSTIAPLILSSSEGIPTMAIGLPGGSRIPSTLVQILTRWLNDEELDYAISMPRWHPVRPRRIDQPPMRWDYEGSLTPETKRELKAMNWEFLDDSNPEAFGGVTAILRESDDRWTGYADSRRTNSVAIVP